MNSTEVPQARRLPEHRVRADLAMLARTTGQPRARSARPTRRFVIAFGLATTGLAATAAAAATVQMSHATDKTLARCHATVDPGRGDSFAGTSVAAADANGVVSITSAVSACSDLWEQGVLKPGQDQASSPTATPAQVPGLTGCVDSDGVAAVFPTSSDVCAALGFKRLIEVR